MPQTYTIFVCFTRDSELKSMNIQVISIWLVHSLVWYPLPDALFATSHGVKLATERNAHVLKFEYIFCVALSMTNSIPDYQQSF